MHMMKDLDPSLLARYTFLDFLLLFKGGFTRSELVTRFEIGEATASRTIAGYLDLFPDTVNYLGPRKGYIAKKGINPNFDHNPIEGLLYITSGLVQSHFNVKQYGPSEYRFQKELDINIVSAITRAVVNELEADIRYISTTSGVTTRGLAPHAIFYANNTWYFRAYDFSNYEFRTFRFSRVTSAIDLGSPHSRKYSSKHDDAWHRIRKVLLRPHPKNPNPDALFLDLGISDKTVKELLISEALLGFVLTDLRVDCSSTHRLNYNEYPLALSNREELSNVKSIIFAPGYLPRKQ